MFSKKVVDKPLSKVDSEIICVYFVGDSKDDYYGAFGRRECTHVILDV